MPNLAILWQLYQTIWTPFPWTIWFWTLLLSLSHSLPASVWWNYSIGPPQRKLESIWHPKITSPSNHCLLLLLPEMECQIVSGFWQFGSIKLNGPFRGASSSQVLQFGPGHQWQQQKKLYPGQLESHTDGTKSPLENQRGAGFRGPLYLSLGIATKNSMPGVREPDWKWMENDHHGMSTHVCSLSSSLIYLPRRCVSDFKR